MSVDLCRTSALRQTNTPLPTLEIPWYVTTFLLFVAVDLTADMLLGVWALLNRQNDNKEILTALNKLAISNQESFSTLAVSIENLVDEMRKDRENREKRPSGS
jgi:hypothetical protein